MNQKNNIRRFILFVVFSCSFIFQTAYSLSFQEGKTSLSDLINGLHITKKSQKEAIGDGSYIEKEKETEKETDTESDPGIDLYFEIFVSPLINGLFTHIDHIDFSPNPPRTNNSIFIAIHSFRI